MRTFITLLLMAPILVYAQDQKASASEAKIKTQYSCRELEATPDGKIITLRKDIKIETPDLMVRGDSAISIDGNKTWTVYGTKEIVFNCEFVAQEIHNSTFQYKYRDKTIYMRGKTAYLE